MKKIKPFAPGLILVLLVIHTHAQEGKTTDAGIHFGVQGGFNLQTFTGSDYWGEELNNRLNPGFHFGGNVILPVISRFYLQPGLLYSLKGAQQDIIEDEITKTILLSYIEVPLNILYRMQLGNGYLLTGLGPYAAYGISGRERTTSGTTTTEIPVRFLPDASDESSSYVYYRGFDAGGNVFLGYELYNGILFQGNVQFGLMEINSDYGLPNDQTSKKNLGFEVSVGYRF